MIRKMVSLVLTITMLTWIYSCTSAVRVSKEKARDPHTVIVSVTDASGDVVQFEDGGRYDQLRKTFSGYTKDGEHVEIPLAEAEYVTVRKTDPILTAFAVIGVLAAAFLLVVAIAAATKESCPFVYSWDGAQYVFDAEPYGGAVCEGLTRTDYCRMEHLVAVDGRYRLMLANEVPETQHTDELTLLAVDHVPGAIVVPDTVGRFTQLQNLHPPVYAQDERGLDLLPFVEAADRLMWQSSLRQGDAFRQDELRHELIFEFDRPADARSATLVFNAGTGLWGSEMIREMLALRGDRVDDWYAAIDAHGPELEELYRFNLREELYLLKLYVEEEDGWVQQAIVHGAGPYITEDRVYHLDLSDVTGDRLRLRVHPPRGFWSFDYVAIDYGQYADPVVTPISVAEAVDHTGTDVASELRAADRSYQDMPRIGDWAKIEYEVPPQAPGTERSLFLKATGYYDIHLSKDEPEQTQLVRELLDTPGKIAEFAMERYLVWNAMAHRDSE